MWSQGTPLCICKTEHGEYRVRTLTHLAPDPNNNNEAEEGEMERGLREKREGEGAGEEEGQGAGAPSAPAHVTCSQLAHLVALAQPFLSASIHSVLTTAPSRRNSRHLSFTDKELRPGRLSKFSQFNF